MMFKAMAFIATLLLIFHFTTDKKQTEVKTPTQSTYYKVVCGDKHSIWVNSYPQISSYKSDECIIKVKKA